MTVPTEIYIDEDIKEKASRLFQELGLDLSTAISIFLRECISKGDLPFFVELPQYRKETIEAMEESKRISKDSSIKSFKSIKELNEELDK